MKFLLTEKYFALPKALEFPSFINFWQEAGFAYDDNDLINAQSFVGDNEIEHEFVELSAESLSEDAWQRCSLRSLLMNLPHSVFSDAARAWQYANFFRTHQYCGVCGSKMQADDNEIAMQCTNCTHRCYPRVSPCIIVSVMHENKLLLAQGDRQKSAGFYSTLAGFVETGESLEQAVHREVMEEVGVKVKNVRYFSSQPWPFPHSLMCGFLADYDSGEILPDGVEITSADFFAIDDLPKTPPKVSIAGKLIEASIDLIKSR